MKFQTKLLVVFGCLLWSLPTGGVMHLSVHGNAGKERLLFCSTTTHALGKVILLPFPKVPLILSRSGQPEILNPIIEWITVAMVDLHSIREIQIKHDVNQAMGRVNDSIDPDLNLFRSSFLGRGLCASYHASVLRVPSAPASQGLKIRKRTTIPNQVSSLGVVSEQPLQIIFGDGTLASCECCSDSISSFFHGTDDLRLSGVLPLKSAASCAKTLL
jgi:hypothetical protein